jgi:hypothetical protein
VRGIVQKPQVPILGCTIHDVEISIDELHQVDTCLLMQNTLEGEQLLAEH